MSKVRLFCAAVVTALFLSVPTLAVVASRKPVIYAGSDYSTPEAYSIHKVPSPDSHDPYAAGHMDSPLRVYSI